MRCGRESDGLRERKERHMKSRRSHDSPMIAADRSLLWRFCAGGNARKVANEDTSAFQTVGETFGETAPDGARKCTLEEHCRRYWRTDPRGFIRLAKELPIFQIFVDLFQGQDAARQTVDSGRRSAPRASCRRQQ